jgi:hypothetical protein
MAAAHDPPPSVARDIAAPPRVTAAELLRYWGTVAAWMLVITTLSSDAFSATNTNRYIDPILRWLFPGISIGELFFAHSVIRKIAHFTEFFILGLLAYWASRRGRLPPWRWRWALQALLVAGGYAVLDEGRQAFVPSRTPSLSDSGIDFLGALASQMLLYQRRRWLIG